MGFNYEAQTKKHYQSDDVALAYHQAYTQRGGLNGLRFRFIASRERDAVRQLLRKIPHATVVDVPTGTGKMASVFAELGCRVTACDVSENMLAIAREAFAQAGCEVDEFRVMDLEIASEQLNREFDAFICIRLMHRVPDDVKRRMLRQISLLAPNAIVSFAIDNPWQRFRTMLSRKLFGALAAGAKTRLDFASTVRLLEDYFDVVEHRAVAPGISSERVFLLRSKSGI